MYREKLHRSEGMRGLSKHSIMLSIILLATVNKEEIGKRERT
ncbi:MAG: hypothetical protein PWQ39_5 [Thermacetogenium sp.]|nr:hypothetical protein [Thermacetogenium sp.]